MAHDTAQLTHRIRAEIDALRRALDDRRAAPRRLAASVVAAYQTQIDRHYAELERISLSHVTEVTSVAAADPSPKGYWRSILIP